MLSGATSATMGWAHNNAQDSGPLPKVKRTRLFTGVGVERKSKFNDINFESTNPNHITHHVHTPVLHPGRPMLWGAWSGLGLVTSHNL